jgi:hypothetical protein
MADAKKSSAAAIALAWVIVVAPTCWGLTYTVQSALKLFTTSAPAAAGAQGSK